MDDHAYETEHPPVRQQDPDATAEDVAQVMTHGNDTWDGLTKLPGETPAQRCVRISNEAHLKYPGDPRFFAYMDSRMASRSDSMDT